MILITPRIEADATLPYGGLLTVSFPADSDCEDFSVPLCPTKDILNTWIRIDHTPFFHLKIPDGYICESAPSSPGSRSPSEILSSYFDESVHLVYKGPSPRACNPTISHPKLKATFVYQDCYPLMFLSEESVYEVERQVRSHVGTQGIDECWSTEPLVIERFRPNIVMKGAGPFAEDTWKEIRIGSDESSLASTPVIPFVSKCTRCLLPNVSPDTGVRDKAVPYKVIMKFRTGVDPANKMKPCVGCNGVPMGSGKIRVGDIVHVR